MGGSGSGIRGDTGQFSEHVATDSSLKAREAEVQAARKGPRTVAAGDASGDEIAMPTWSPVS